MGYLLTTSDGKTVRCATGVVAVSPVPTGVLIGEHYYPYTQIGSRIWTTQNLYEPLGNFGNTTGTDSCWVDYEVNSPKGMLYEIDGFYNSSRAARQDLEAMLPTGWRIPTFSDVQDLFSAANTQWEPLTLPAYNGTDTLGFHAQLMTPMAIDHASPDRYPLGRNTVCKFIMIPYTVNGDSNNIFQLYHLNAGERMTVFGDNGAWRVCIRVCKDA